MAGSVAAGVVAAVAAARLTEQPAVLLAAGLLAAAAVALAGGRWVAAGALPGHRRGPERATRLASALAVAGATALLITPGGAEVSRPAESVHGEEYWALPTGSLLRVVEVPARSHAFRTPVVVLHGGPGTPDLARDAAFFGRLADDGFTVYVYDQVGAGRSTRLGSPEEYSRDRDVADLEALRRRVGAQRMLLVGHSYGATVVAGYLAAHPGRVGSVVLLSPASLDPADTSGANLRRRLGTEQLVEVYARVLRPRNLLVFTLLQVNAEAAYAVAGNAEMDAQNDLVYAAGESAVHCSRQALEPPPTGTGFYRLNHPQSASAPTDVDLRPRLAGDRTPTLLLKGSCDYLSWASAVSYVQTLRDVQIVYLRAGHNLHQDAPDEVLGVVRAFLTGDPLPVTPLTGTAPPPDYEGPR